MLGMKVGSYVTEKVLARNSTMTLYLGHHAHTGRKALVRLLRADLAASCVAASPFDELAMAAASSSHPCIPRILESGCDDRGQVYIVMDWRWDGEVLEVRLQREGKLEPRRAVAITHQIVSALKVAHRCRIVHGGLSPDSIFLIGDDDMTGRVRVSIFDFGIRARFGLPSATAYAAPEQLVDPMRPEPRVDLYAVGCLLFHMVCGRPPFTGSTAGEMVDLHLNVMPPRARVLEPDLAPELDDLLARLLAKNPAERPRNAGEVQYLLPAMSPLQLRPDWQEIELPTTTASGVEIELRPDSGRWRWRLFLLTSVVAGAAVLAWWLLR